MTGYPIVLDLRGRSALVVGLGPVGARKAAGLLAAGARVVGVDPADGIAVPGEIVYIKEQFRVDHVLGQSLVFAAGPPEVNRRVVAAANAAGIWVNAASGPESGDFAVPAVWRDGPVLLAVATSGASPALSRSIRDRAAASVAGAGALASLLAEARPDVLARLDDPEDRRRLLADWGDARWLDALAADGPESVRRVWIAALDDAAGPRDGGSSLHGSAEIS